MTSRQRGCSKPPLLFDFLCFPIDVLGQTTPNPFDDVLSLRIVRPRAANLKFVHVLVVPIKGQKDCPVELSQRLVTSYLDGAGDDKVLLDE